MQNKLGWESRYRNYSIFRNHIYNITSKYAVALFTAEIAFKDSPFVVTSPDNAHHLQLKTDCEIWGREAALNLLIQRLPESAEYICWTDPDQIWLNPNWAEDTIKLLHRYDAVQMFSHSQDLDANFMPLEERVESYIYSYIQLERNWSQLASLNEKIVGGPWAIRKSVLSQIGMLPDWAITASADLGITMGLLGHVEVSFEKGYTAPYCNKWRVWGNRAYSVIRGNIGYLPGTIIHYFHGHRKNREYTSGRQLLVDHTFNPSIDIIKDWQGLYRFTGANPKLQDAIRVYMERLNETASQ
jgi:hypothetical protein